MKKIAILLSLTILLVSCREDIRVDDIPENPYGVIFENATNGQLFILSKQLIMGMPEILPGETSNPIYGNTPNVSITYYGEGTHFQKVQKDILLNKNKISKVILDYPITP